MKIKKELYIEHPKPGYAVFIGASYIGTTGLNRIESMCYGHYGRDDLPVEPKIRYSYDNGITWTDWQLDSEVVAFEKSNIICGFQPGKVKIGPGFEDPSNGMHISVELRQTIVKNVENNTYSRYRNHCFWMMSKDKGKTWTEGKLLRYENGADLDPDNPLDPNFLENNSMYSGGMISYKGDIIFCATSVNIPKDASHTDPDGTHGNWWSPSGARDIGSALFIAKWDNNEEIYKWKRSNCVWVPMSVSCRGLAEGYPAELSDGRILIVWRGSDTPETPGHKWFSISEDGGNTLSQVREMRYDDGTGFYSPSSIHKFIRHSVNGKLYWIANICEQPPHGNGPRFPLIIAEIDENIPAVKRNTVSIIADREPGDSELLQWSNFNVFENRETHEFELYMTNLGAKSPGDDNHEFLYESDSYKFTIKVD